MTGYYRTSVFEFPGCRLTSEGPVLPQVIAEDCGLKAVVVSNLPAYFREGHSRIRHYAIDVSLRAGVERVYNKQTGQQTPPQGRMFVVIERHARVAGKLTTREPKEHRDRIAQWWTGKVDFRS